ncbi:MAG: NADH-quinone oxidoreductase subunit L [Acidimicrobiia bacterium]
MARDLLDLVWLVPLLPLTGAVVLLLAGKRIGDPKAGWLATTMMALAFVWSVVMLVALLSLPGEQRTHVTNLFTWFKAGTLTVHVGFLADPLSITWILLVTGVGSLIHLYAIGYMHGDERFSRFFAYFNLFATAMLVLVLASSFLLTFLGWEGVGLCSYLLIGFWFERTRAASASVKAFVTNRVGDFGFMVAMFFIVGALGSLDYSAMNGVGGLSKSTATAIALLLFLGCIGKSAQIGLHIWLPDAMEGPTPVSALNHAATMVTAGVFLVCRANPFFERSGSAATVVAVVGAVTALFAGTVALVQPDIKRVLAYSTVSQLGYMFLAAGVGAYPIAVFFVLVHAFYKASLFLGSGTVIHGTEETQDIRVMGGLRRFMPFTSMAFVVATIAIVGLPPFAGFWAKDDVLSSAFFDSSYVVYALGLLAALLTAMYMTREVLLVFFGNERFHPPALAGADGGDVAQEAGHAPAEHDITASPTVDYGTPPSTAGLRHEPHEGNGLMVFPVVMLAALAVVGGLLDLPWTRLEVLTHFLEPVFRAVKDAPEPSSFLAAAGLDLLAVAVAGVGIVVAFALYRRGLEDPAVDPLDERLGPLGRLFGHAWYYDEGIAAAVGGPIRRGAQWLADVFDQKIIDGAVNGVARGFGSAGTQLRKVQTGLVRQYALAIALGTAALILWALIRMGS